MSYIGLQPTTRFLATSTQKISSDGTSYEYALNRGVSKAADLTLFVGNVSQVPEVDYTAEGTQLFFTYQPAAGTDNIIVNYSSGALSTVDLAANSFPQGSTVDPAIRYVDGTSTGIWFPSVSQIGLTTSGNTRVTVSDDPTAVDASTGALRVNGGVGVSQKLIVGGTTEILSTSASVDSTSGALVVNGGVGVAGELNVGGGISVGGDFTVAGTFTTTGSDSLVINDPFLFLANTNAGDSLDTGFVSTYNDGSTQRYTGFFRDITDGHYRLFDNLDVEPTTVVDTGDTSFNYAILELGEANLVSTTNSSTSFTGALKVQGGIGARGSFTLNSDNNAIAIRNGGSTATGNIGASGGAFNYGWFTNLVGTLQTAAQTNITTVGTLTTLAVGGSVQVNSSNVATAITNSAGSGWGNIGASGATFNTAFVKATSAQYADVAENYTADATYEPGTVLHFGGEQEVSLCNVDACSRVAGIVSTNPAYIMNDALQAEHVVAVALLGRVPCKVQGTIKKGDMVVSAGNGHARAESNPQIGTVIGKALENFDGEQGVIEVVVGRN